MKKMNKLIAAIALSAVTVGAFAAGDYYQNRVNNPDAAPSCQYHKFSGQKALRDGAGLHGKFIHHSGKNCQSKFMGKGQNVTPEKRQALMQLRVENKLERMTAKFNLTAEQQTKVRAILSDKQQQKMQLRQESRKEIRAVLTEEQRQLMGQRMYKNMKAHSVSS